MNATTWRFCPINHFVIVSYMQITIMYIVTDFK